MARGLRVAPGGFVFHVLNRASHRRTIFETPGDYADFVRLLFEARERVPVRLVCYCVMPNHWHLIVWPREDGQLTAFVHWLASAHANRWKRFHDGAPPGHLYQGRFKSFPIKSDAHYFSVVRYVERNALRAGRVDRAERWRWGSLSHRLVQRAPALDEGPLPLPVDWIERVNAVETQAELDALRSSVSRGAPFGDRAWTLATARALRLEASLRPRGRPVAAPRA
jgi:putative transposase